MNLIIQGCRGLAILMVFFLHAFDSALRSHWIIITPGNNVTSWLLMSGNVGVDIFFIISGYLAVQGMKNKISYWKYLIKRIIRIYPVFLLLLIFTYCVGPLFPNNFLSNITMPDLISSFLSNLLLLPGIINNPPAIPVSWALSYIFLFYVLWGAAYRSYESLQNSIFYVAGLVVSLAGFVFFIYIHPRSIFFIVGVFVCYSEPFFRKYALYEGYYSLAAGIFLLLMITILSVSNYATTFIFMASFCGYLFFISILLIRNSPFHTFLTSRFMTFIGNISYSFYLIHGFALYLVVRIFRKFYFMHSPQAGFLILFMAISILLAVILSWVSYTYIEVRFTNKYLRSINTSKNV